MDKLTRDIIRGHIQRDPVGRQLTDAAVERAVDYGASLSGKGLNFGQLKDASIKHVTHDVFKDK